MTKTSCIVAPANQGLVIVREHYRKICAKAPDKNVAAALLNLFEHWANVRLGMRQQDKAHNKIRKEGDLDPAPITDLWIWKTTKDMQSELMSIWGQTKIENARKWLVDIGFLEQRSNPDYAWDKTYQYKLQIGVVQCAIDDPMYLIKLLEGLDLRNGEAKSTEAIPEVTTETTSKDSKTDSKNESVLPSPTANGAQPEQSEQGQCKHDRAVRSISGIMICAECGEPIPDVDAPTPPSAAAPPSSPEPAPLPELLTNPHCNRKHLTACLAWALDNFNHSAIQRPLNMLLGKDGAGEWHTHRLSLDNEDSPNMGPVSDYELIAFGAWMRMRQPDRREFQKYRPQTADKIARKMELFRGEREYKILVEAARRGTTQLPGLDEMIRLNMNGTERADAILVLGTHLGRPITQGSGHAPPQEPDTETVQFDPEQQAEVLRVMAELVAGVDPDK